MRFKIVDRKTVDLSESPVHDGSDFQERFVDAQEKAQSVVVFDQGLRILPLVSDWLTEELSLKQTPPSTISTYAKNISYFLDYLNERQSYKHLELDEAFLHIYPHDIQAYFTYLKNECNLSSNTIRNRDATFQSFFNCYLCKPRRDGKSIRDDNPYTDGLLSMAAKSKVVEMCTLNELKALLLCSHSERERAMIQFMYDTGVRRTEVTRVKKADIDKAFNSNKSTLIVDDKTVAYPSDYKALNVAGVKGRKREVKPRFTLPSKATLARTRRYFSTPEYRKLTKKYGSDSHAFINSEGRPYTPSSIGKILHKLSGRAIKKGFLDRAIHPHMLRHGFAGGLLRSPDLGDHSIDKLVVLQQCLGHAKIATTQIYTAMPYDIYGQYADNNGVILTRAALMERLAESTRMKVPLRGKK
ncbi:tyrosine-type recombinase/integrase [Pseudidiomarina sp. 1APR75-33.1]|uniref:tyrosine-type recombinase/integrase n=1 Tax=Pseudidiomarina terrestris TaxID=2820060 RepID=UPI00264CA27C|nr:tyrosine-type recombinase/integrase [Pseudidiomarina sp. 1APR75-33.1]MDN7126406.1 tyrosine-type recombinase/integrase [Pseudidiomarina sp. 1APR75-33.1]